MSHAATDLSVIRPLLAAGITLTVEDLKHKLGPIDTVQPLLDLSDLALANTSLIYSAVEPLRIGDCRRGLVADWRGSRPVEKIADWVAHGYIDPTASRFDSEQIAAVIKLLLSKNSRVKSLMPDPEEAPDNVESRDLVFSNCLAVLINKGCPARHFAPAFAALRRFFARDPHASIFACGSGILQARGIPASLIGKLVDFLLEKRLNVRLALMFPSLNPVVRNELTARRFVRAVSVWSHLAHESVALEHRFDYQPTGLKVFELELDGDLSEPFPRDALRFPNAWVHEILRMMVFATSDSTFEILFAPIDADYRQGVLRVKDPQGFFNPDYLKKILTEKLVVAQQETEKLRNQYRASREIRDFLQAVVSTQNAQPSVPSRSM